MTISKQTLFFLTCLALLFQNRSFGGNETIGEEIRQLFEWGEYEKIIELAPSYLSNITLLEDSLLTSKLHLYLGVALFTMGDVGKSREEFLASLSIKPDILLDKHYVSENIWHFFLTVKEEYRRVQEEEKKLAHIKKQQEIETNQKQAVIDSLGKTVSNVRKKGFFYSGLGTAILTVGFSGTAVYQYYQGEAEYNKFKIAAAMGDLETYEAQKKEVKKYNTYTMLLTSASAMCALSSSLFFVIANKQRKRNSSTFSLHINPITQSVQMTLIF